MPVQGCLTTLHQPNLYDIKMMNEPQVELKAKIIVEAIVSADQWDEYILLSSTEIILKEFFMYMNIEGHGIH